MKDRRREKLEELIKESVLKKKIYLVFIAGLALAGVSLTLHLFLGNFKSVTGVTATLILWILSFMALGGFGVALYDLRREFTEEIKKYLVETAAEDMFDSFDYKPLSGFDIDELDEADLMFMRYSNTGSDDMMTGEYNDVQFRRADININTGSNSLESQFYGTWTIYTFLKPFTADLQVTSREMAKHSRVNRTFFTRKSEKRHLFETGDPEFDELFTCSGQDEQEAMTLLTPMVRKRLIRLYQDTGLPMIVGWKDRQLHYITGNALAPYGYKLRADMDLDAMVEETSEKLLLIRRVIDDLIMSRSIFSEYALEQYRETGDMQNEEGYRRQ